MKLSKSTTTADFVAAATVAHGTKYDYSQSVYRGRLVKVSIACHKHGSFMQTPACHVGRRQGCPKCGLETIINVNPPGRTTEQFIVEAQSVHGNLYDYSLSVYAGLHTKLFILCGLHGGFHQSPNNHLKGAGCPRCAVERRAAAVRKSQFDFLNDARTTHGDKYTYSDYVDDRTRILINCSIHGDFQQLPNSHLNGRGCPSCALNVIASKLRVPFSDLLLRFRCKHGYIYDYDESSYTDTRGVIRAKCATHGWFEQGVQAHLAGGGCQRCGSSCFQRSVGVFLENLGQTVIYNDRNVLGGRELDLLVEERKFAVECDGLYWHSFDHLETRNEKYKHHTKHSLASEIGVSLISIREDEWIVKRQLVELMLKHRLGLSLNRIYARNCVVVKVCQSRSKSFCDANHINGFRHASHTYGLDFDGKLVALMSFSTHRKYQFEVIRYCVDGGTCIVGGASKLFMAFRRDVNPHSVLSYADRRYSQGQLYHQLGFKLCGVTGPNYGYTKDFNVYSRQAFQKHKLASKLNHYDPALSESANMFNNGYRRLWDAGHFRFVWSK